MLNLSRRSPPFSNQAAPALFAAAAASLQVLAWLRRCML
jgi:hypothetical protein